MKRAGSVKVFFNISSLSFPLFVCNPFPTIPGERAQNIFKQLRHSSYFSALYCLLVACVEKTQRLEAVQNLLDCCCRATFGQLPCTQPSHYPPHCVHILLGTGSDGQTSTMPASILTFKVYTQKQVQSVYSLYFWVQYPLPWTCLTSGRASDYHVMCAFLYGLLFGNSVSTSTCRSSTAIYNDLTKIKGYDFGWYPVCVYM